MIIKKLEQLPVAFAPYHFPNKIGTFGKGILSILLLLPFFLANLKELWINSMNVTDDGPRVILSGSRESDYLQSYS